LGGRGNGFFTVDFDQFIVILFRQLGSIAWEHGEDSSITRTPGIWTRSIRSHVVYLHVTYLCEDWSNFQDDLDFDCSCIGAALIDELALGFERVPL